MEREILLIGTGGLIGALSSIITLFVIYFLEGMRLRRRWAREDYLRMQEKREEMQAMIFAADRAAQVPERPADD